MTKLNLRELFLWPNRLTLQAPAVAVLWQLVLALSLRTSLGPFEPWVLALAVWLIYVVDHLVDTARPICSAVEPVRKQFCRAHWRAFLAAAVAAATFLTSWSRQVLWASAIREGWKIAAAVALYMALIHLMPSNWRGRWPRELVVAAIFTLGIFTPVWLSAAKSPALFLAPSAIFALLCLTNCSLIETWEWESNGSPSDQAPHVLARWVGHHVGAIGLFISISAGALALTPALPTPFAVSACLSGFALAALAVRRESIPIRFLSALADLALGSPLIVFLALWALKPLMK